MPVFGQDHAMPGIRATDLTQEAVVGFGKVDQLIQSQGVIAGAARYNDGASDQVVLPGGLLLGGPVSGKLKQWDPTDTTGYEKLFGILLYDQRMTDSQGSNLDRTAAPIVIGGPVKTSQLYASGYAKGLNGRAVELAARAAMNGRFILDDEPYGSPFGGWIGIPVAKTADYTILESDNNRIFTTLGATDRVRFTLPAVAMGYRFGFYDMAGVGIDIVAASGTPLVGDGDATRGEVQLAPVIGSFAEVIGASATQYIFQAQGGAPSPSRLSPERIQLVWIPGLHGKPAVTADKAYQYDLAMEILGVNHTTALVTLDAEGGIIMTTAGADADQMALCAHQTAGYSAWKWITWGTDQEVIWEAVIQTGANITNAIIAAGLKLTISGANAAVIGQDNDGVWFRYEDDVNSGKWQVVTNIGGADTQQDAAIVVAVSTQYHLKIAIDAGRVARFYINGVLVHTSTALTDATDLQPTILVEADGAAAAKAITVLGEALSRNIA